MAEVITLELPDELASKIKDIAANSQRRLEDILVEWIDHAASEPPLEVLPEEQILALCELQMENELQDELSNLLAQNREGLLEETKQQRLDELMQIYRHGLIRKAQALQIAVVRGLKPPLN